MNIASKNLWFRNFLNEANINFCDGIGVKLGAKLLGKEIQHRYTPPDWIDGLFRLCVKEKYSIFLLGTRFLTGGYCSAFQKVDDWKTPWQMIPTATDLFPFAKQILSPCAAMIPA